MMNEAIIFGIGVVIYVFGFLTGWTAGHSKGKVDAYESGGAIVSETPEEDPRR